MAPRDIRILSGDTDRAPDEGSTSSSLSIEVSGASVRLISAEVRARYLDRLAQRLNCAVSELSVAEGAFVRGGAPTGQDYWSFAAEVDLAEPATGARRTSRRRNTALSDAISPGRSAGQDFGRGVHPRLDPARHVACADVAPALPRRAVVFAG